MRRCGGGFEGGDGASTPAGPPQLDIVFTVVTRLEVPQLRAMVRRLDPDAFIIQHIIEDTVGGMIKRRPLH